MASTTIVTTIRIVGQRNARLRLSHEERLHAMSGPTPVSKSRNSPIGTFTLLKNGAPTVIFSPVTISLILGNTVPQSTANALASSSRLLNRKLDSRDRTL